MTDFVIAEVHGLTLGRAGPATALQLVERVLASGRVELVEVGRDRFDEALAVLQERPGRRLSLVDATSFVVMRSTGIETAFTLDNDFAAEGFATLP